MLPKSANKVVEQYFINETCCILKEPKRFRHCLQSSLSANSLLKVALSWVPYLSSAKQKWHIKYINQVIHPATLNITNVSTGL